MEQIASLNSIVVVAIVLFQFLIDAGKWKRWLKEAGEDSSTGPAMQISKNEVLIHQYERLVVHYGFIPALPVVYFQAGVLSRNGEVIRTMTPMYVMILLLAVALMILLNWTYYLTFGRMFGILAPKPAPKSTVLQLCDKHLHSRKLLQAWRNVYVLLTLFCLTQSLMMLNCAVLGDVYNQAQCIETSLVSTLLQRTTWVTVILHILFLLIIDLLPACAFLFIYLPRVQSVISGHIDATMLAYKRKLSVAAGRGTTIAGNDLITRYTVRVRETLTARKSSRNKSRVVRSEFDMVHTGPEAEA